MYVSQLGHVYNEAQGVDRLHIETHLAAPESIKSNVYYMYMYIV